MRSERMRRAQSKDHNGEDEKSEEYTSGRKWEKEQEWEERRGGGEQWGMEEGVMV